MSDLVNQVFDAVAYITSRQIESTTMDVTISANVVKLQDAAIGEYKVYYEGATFSAYTLNVTSSYAVGDSVYVLVPGGDYSATKIILGEADFSSNTSYADLQAMSNQWRIKGPNWLSSTMYWKDENGAGSAADVEGGIVVTTMGDEAAIVNTSTDESIEHPAFWRNYIFNRSGFPETYEETLTDIRKTKSKNISPATESANFITAMESVDSTIQLYAAQVEYIMVSAKFETSFLVSHSSGDYGVMVEVFVDNPSYTEDGDEPMYNLQRFQLSMSDFNGSPYNFSNPAYQFAVFPVSKNVVKGLARVYLFQDDGWVTDLEGETGYYEADGTWVQSDTGTSVNYVNPVCSRNNIFATDVSIYWCEPVDLSTQWFWMQLWPTNTSLYYGEGEMESVTKSTIQAKLYYGASEITAEDACKFVWYRKRYSTLSSAAANFEKDEYGNTWASYLPDGEQGWCPIEEMIKRSGTQEEMEANPSEVSTLGESAEYRLGKMVNGIFTEVTDGSYADALEVPITEVPWQWEYMCVCYYNPNGGDLDSVSRSNWNDALIWQTETITNLSSIHNFELPEPYIPSGGSEAVLRVRNNTSPWDLDYPYDPDNYSTPSPYKDWWCRWWVSSGSTYYAMQDTTYDRFIKGLRTTKPYLVNEVVTFKAQVYGREDTNSGTDIERVEHIASLWEGSTTEPDMELEYNEYEIANLEITVAPTDSPSIVVSFAGQTHHNYNSSGILNNSLAVGTQYDITPTLTITNSALMNFSVEWIAPDGVPLGSRTDEEITLGTGYNMTDITSMLKDMWASYPSGDDTQCVLHYKVEEAYSLDKATADNNTFKLRITYLDGTYEDVACTITYSMAGYEGTQGSEWTANIWPCNHSSLFEDSSVGLTAYTYAIADHPVPLVVNGSHLDPTPGKAMLGDDDFGLYLRPFIRKNGIAIENLTESTKYSYKVYWDTRLPAVNNSTSMRAAASYGNFLKLSHQGVSGRDVSDYGEDGSYSGDSSSLVGGTAYSRGTTQPADVEDSQAFTTSVDTENGVGDTKTYGAIRVKWNDKTSITGSDYGGEEVTFADIGYSFYVKARIEIFYDGTGVASITSFFPVDIIFAPNGIGSIDPEKMRTNWPTQVLYTSNGIAPTTTTSALYFKYGDNVEGESLDNVYTAIPDNLTSDIQQVSTISGSYNLTGEYSAATTYTRTLESVDICYYNQYFFRVRDIGATVKGITPDIDRRYDTDHEWAVVEDLSDWYLYPRDYYFFEDYDNGALGVNYTTNSGLWPSGAMVNPDFADWNGAYFIRTIVYYINQYGNESINGWDGKSIDINEDDGTIFSPTIGAGWKHPFTNTFSGVVMGIDTSQLKANYIEHYGGVSQDSINMNPYMTGLYGYQDGYCSFGIMENGTAFFGRADTGGRITIDGFNAQIYGGTTMDGETGLNADMKNRMRLSFIDFGGSENELDLETWADEEVYFEKAEDYADWLYVYNLYYYYVTGKNETSYKTVTGLGFYISDILDWDNYRLDTEYRLEVDTKIKAFIDLMNALNVGCTIGPIVNGKPGIAMEGFVVDSTIDSTTGWATATTLTEATSINCDFASFFAPGVGSETDGRGDFNTTDTATGIDYLAAQYGGYVNGNSYSTPAIEIGSYKDWVLDENGTRREETREPWIRARHPYDFDDYIGSKKTKTCYRSGSDLIRSYTTEQIQSLSESAVNLEIPGYRKFLVTYDGTMYAMNAFIKGNIIGSNIIASQFFNADGSYVVFENGDLGIGPTTGSSSGWNETRVENPYSSLWSGEVPTSETVNVTTYFDGDEESAANFENVGSDGLSNSFAFFVANNGAVVCEKMHIGGGSINIGGFHVLGEDEADTGRAGDVVSFGTMYLVGAYPIDNGDGTTSQNMPNIGDTAVEAWGDFNLRGRLVNLGPVYLGGKPEKEQPDSDWDSTYNSTTPGSFNSPFSIVPDTEINGAQGNPNDDPNLPVQIGVWPLYFRAQESTSEEGASGNLNWVCFAASETGYEHNTFMPAFAARPELTFVGDTNDNMPASVFWRVDQVGMWSDAIIFTNREWYTDVSDKTSLSLTKHGLAFFGWWNTKNNNNVDVWSLSLQNYSRDAQNIVFETPRGYRFGSRGHTAYTRSGSTSEYSGSPVDSIIIFETAENYKFSGANKRSTATFAIQCASTIADSEGSGGSPYDIASLTGGSIFLGGQRKLLTQSQLSGYCGTNASGDVRAGYDYVVDAFISIDCLMGTSSIDDSWRTVTDELDREITNVPKYNPGQIWVKGKGVAIDGSDAGFNTATSFSIANPGVYLTTIRLNRQPNGLADESNSDGTSADLMAAGMSPKASLYMTSCDLDLVSRNLPTSATISGDHGSGNIHIRTNGDEVTDMSTWARANEIFLWGGNRATVTGSAMEAHGGRGAIRVNGRDEISLATYVTGAEAHVTPPGTANAIIMNQTTDSITMAVDGTGASGETPIYTRFFTMNGSVNSEPGIRLVNIADSAGGMRMGISMTENSVYLQSDIYGTDDATAIMLGHKTSTLWHATMSLDSNTLLTFRETYTKWMYNESIYILMDDTGITLAGYSAEEQHGIYARFG